MEQYNFPTVILSGSGSLKEFTVRLKDKNHKKILIVTDKTIEKLGLVKKLTDLISAQNIPFEVFSDTRPNPVDEDVEKGVKAYQSGKCDSIIALGGGSPMDVAKVIKVMVANPPPLSQYDDTLGGDKLIVNPMPRLYAITTTAGTGSEVGRAGVIIMKDTGKKTIFFHPDLMPDIAVLEPEMTVGLPPDITAATGMDAFVHSMEAYFSPMFHPMADGIALQSMELCLDWLPTAYQDGKNIEAREKMLLAATMGATAFQKGLGMIHSLAHPLSSSHDIHHGLANALLLPESLEFMENANLNMEQKKRIARVQSMFTERNLGENSLAECCRFFLVSLGIDLGLSKYNITSSDLKKLSEEAFSDPCHSCNMIKVTKDDLLKVYEASL